jgi:predicted GNAT family acetyltransferase
MPSWNGVRGGSGVGDLELLMAEVGEVTDNPAMHRFELPIEGEVATAYYAIEDGRMVFTHTEVPFALSGRGYGSKLARGAFEAALSRGIRVIAKCPFMAAYALKHPEYAAILDG